MTDWDQEVDLLVLGSGAAGLTAALVGANEGLSTLVVEKSEWLGGTTARSAGTVWIPGHRQLADPEADAAEAARYLDALVGDRGPRDLRTAYLRHAPDALEYLRTLGIGFRHTAGAVDYHPELPGAGVGRALEPEPFDGRRLGRRAFGRVRHPVREFTLFGGTLMVRRAEADQLAAAFAGETVRAAVMAGRLGLRWLLDRAGGHPRGTRLTMGNALVAALYGRLLATSADVWFTAHADELVVDERGRVSGAVVHRRGAVSRIRARRGVVLACGGFAANPALRAEHLPEPVAQFTPAVPEATGDGLHLARAAGGTLGASQDDNAMWFPGSLGRRRDGSTAVFPHIWDRAKPGIVAVDRSGRRFVDESLSYHRFVRAMYATDAAVPAWLVTDAASLRKYGLGMVRPYLPRVALRRHLADGYLQSGPTVRALAGKIGVDPDALEQTAAAACRAAAVGRDDEFGKGQSPFGHQYGDRAHRPNVNLGPLDRPPFYAVAVFPVPLATTLGLQTDADARVLTAAGEPVPGLYACGDDANSVTASEYPGAGCRIGSALTFGYLAARHAARGLREGDGV
ncbi:FAD-dependent oxidoreductase [Amycolatopsis jiangsuensis]|uniref:Succinate dehydrogenase/fumarate reductase flavoprotein subunit n=1 Tax=Amycolatopsis jiangsuensis TaxID=1181879 RepID=A0A840IZP4_9PSEU|nr:FAD-dependent oxidoreductase [Amycolatopsis jiangsuensis]MBB4688331.1 succinate dehydrogenase/fumarate reductase flavoprotein subunit [Amycolatopsis jiangsuensis]